MDVRGQRLSLVLVEYEFGWGPTPVWVFRRREKSIAPAGIQIPQRRLFAVLATAFQLCYVTTKLFLPCLCNISLNPLSLY